MKRITLRGVIVNGQWSMVNWLVFIILFAIFLTIDYRLWTIDCYADTIYLNDGTTEKGLIVEEFYDRYVFTTPDGEKELLKSNIDEIFFGEPYQNYLYLGRRFEENGDFEKALQFYRLALRSKPDYKEAENAIKGLEDAKWRFKKSWTYKELKDILKSQLGITLKEIREKIVIETVSPQTAREGSLSSGDVLISCWARPLSYAGLKNASRFLIGLPNTFLNLIIERDIKTEASGGFKLFFPLVINIEYEGPVVKSIDTKSHFYKSGLREGDLIVRINGESTRYMKLPEVKRKVLNATTAVITVRREVILMRKKVEIKNAMWVWHSKEILLNNAKRKELLDFCRRKNIGILFFQLQYQFIPPLLTTKETLRKQEEAGFIDGTICRLLYESRLKDFLREAHSQNIAVHALDGGLEFCLESGHPLVLAQLKAITDFNKAAPAEERFDGVHYDNEPYLLPAFNSVYKQDIIDQFVKLNEKCKDFIIASSGQGLEFGIDIPFWFDELDGLDAKLIDICDNVGIMDYRNFASGPDGIVAHALDELKYASKVGKKVFVGVETSKYPKQEVYFISALTEEEFNAKVSDTLHRLRFEGFTMRVHTYNDKKYIGLVKPNSAKEEDFKRALYKLSDFFSPIPKPETKEEFEKLTLDGLFAISTNPEYRDIGYEEYNIEERAFLIFKAKEVMLEKLTFADMREEDLDNVLSEAKKEFETYSAFAGFAFHHYKSYKELCEKK